MMKSQSTGFLRNTLSTIVVIIALLASSVFSQKAIDRRTRDLKKNYLFIPDVDVVKRFTLGFDEFIADIYWLRCVQYAAERHYTANGLTWLYRSLDLVTTLDTKFETAYLFGGIILASDRDFVSDSITLMKKGMENLPGTWRFPFYIGFNYFFYLQKFNEAADYIMKASRIPGSPSYLPFLASRLLAEANKPETALAFLEKMYNQNKDPVLRAKIEDRMKRVVIERDLIFLQEAVEKYRVNYGKNPENLGELVGEEVIGKVPLEPYGGYYYIERDTGIVKSSIIKERLRFYSKKKQ